MRRLTSVVVGSVLAMSVLCFAEASAQSTSKTQATSCTLNGKTIDNCTPAQLKQAARQAARKAARKAKKKAAAIVKSVKVRLVGVNPANAGMSPLATPSTSTLAAPLAAMAAPGAQPDYFGVANWANSPLPQLDATTGAVATGTGMRKFVDDLPGFCPIGTSTGGNGLGQCLPIAAADTGTFPGSDFYRIGLIDYTKRMHTDLPATGTHLKGYVQLDASNNVAATPQYLGPVILATRNRPVRVLFKNALASDLNVPVDTTYMGAGAVTDGRNSVAAASEKRAVIHLHGGNTPWISDGTPHQWVTPAGGDGQPAALGFQKGFSFQNVPDMKTLVPDTLDDGMGTLYYTNQQSGRLMFYHEHAYGTTRLGVYNGLAAGYLLVDPAQESALQTAGAPGYIVTDPATGAITNADLTHVLPLVIQDKSFVPDNGASGGVLAATDPTWDLARGGAGDLWFPHVYMPNQNPADVTGANGFGRWDYGPWFWPPQNPSGFAANGKPYPCTSSAYPDPSVLLSPLMCPGTPFPSGTPEAFMDTPVVNGTAYPKLTVDPTAYRFHVLNAANDRSLNLGLYVAEPVTLSAVITNPGSGYTAPSVSVDQVNGCVGGSAFADVGDGPPDAAGNPVFTLGIIGVTFTSMPTGCTAAPSITITDATGTSASVAAVMSQNTDVKMVPALSRASGRAMPNCAQKLPMAGGGQVTALLDASGNLLNAPTGLPAGCWPGYSSAQGYTAGPFGEAGALSWGNSDNRLGGIPDPTTAGPPIIQIAAEGGILPQLSVIPSTPVSYDYNKRSITVLNVLNHGLWLGPAERADIMVDFSAFAGRTLILYNDAPAPVPAGDPRLDYYTNGPDQSDSGGAPSTLAGYGPNMRTIMQITVNATCSAGATCSALNLSSVKAAVPNIFAATQDQVIVPEPVYPAGNGKGPATYIPIQATSLTAWLGGPIGSLTLTNGGAGFTSVPTVSITGGGGTGATATATLSTSSVTGFAVTARGGGYTSLPTVTISGGGGSGARATAVLTATNSTVRTITVTSGGSGYLAAPTVVIGDPPCTPNPSPTCATATATATVRANGPRNVTAVTVTSFGAGYTTAPNIAFVPVNGGSGAAATATMARAVASLTLTNGGSGYTSSPTVTFSGGGGSGAAATAALAPRVVTGVTLTNPGSGYTSAPTVSITGGGGSGATAIASAPSTPLVPKTIQELFTLDYGRMNATLGVEVPFTNFLTQTTIPYGYVDPPTEIFKDGETQLWKITHNGVDTHFIHFHLFTVQVINRVGWDGAIKPPDPYELGMKDTVRMNPLEDIIVALRPFKQTLPFAVPNSSRPLDVTQPVGASNPNEFTNVDPTNQPATVTNDVLNLGWEYVWHCHILGHEENDMMRAMLFAVAPVAPSTPTGVRSGPNNNQRITVALTATALPNTAVPSGFTIQRARSSAGPWTTLGTVAATVNGTTATASYVDRTVARRTTYYYRAVANNVVGYTKPYAAPAVGYPNVSADSAPSAASAAVTTN